MWGLLEQELQMAERCRIGGEDQQAVLTAELQLQLQPTWPTPKGSILLKTKTMYN